MAPSDHVLLLDLVEVRVQVRGVLQAELSQSQKEPRWCLGTECRPWDGGDGKSSICYLFQ